MTSIILESLYYFLLQFCKSQSILTVETCSYRFVCNHFFVFNHSVHNVDGRSQVVSSRSGFPKVLLSKLWKFTKIRDTVAWHDPPTLHFTLLHTRGTVDCVGAGCRDYHQDNLECLHTSHTLLPITFHTRVLQSVVTVKTLHFVTHVYRNITDTVTRTQSRPLPASGITVDSALALRHCPQSRVLLISVHVMLSSCQTFCHTEQQV